MRGRGRRCQSNAVVGHHHGPWARTAPSRRAGRPHDRVCVEHVAPVDRPGVRVDQQLRRVPAAPGPGSQGRAPGSRSGAPAPPRARSRARCGRWSRSARPAPRRRRRRTGTGPPASRRRPTAPRSRPGRRGSDRADARNRARRGTRFEPCFNTPFMSPGTPHAIPWATGDNLRLRPGGNRAGGSMAQTWEGELPEAAARARMARSGHVNLGLGAVHAGVRRDQGVGVRAGRAGARHGRLPDRVTGGWAARARGAVPGRDLSPTSPPRRAAPFCALVKTMYAARRLALGRAVAECQALGGDGIVGATLRGPPRSSTGGLEFTALGTAVRARCDVRPRRPFTSHLTGQDFAKLIARRLRADRARPRHLHRHPARRLRAPAHRSAAGPPATRRSPGYTAADQQRPARRPQPADEATRRKHGGDGVVVDEVRAAHQRARVPDLPGRARPHRRGRSSSAPRIARFESSLRAARRARSH